jgi:cell division protein ZapA
VKSPKAQHEPVTISILDKEFRIACPPEERDALLASARYLSDKMREIRESGKVVGLDRIAIMAGLTIANELLQQKAQVDKLDAVAAPRLIALQRRMEQILNGHRNGKIDF